MIRVGHRGARAYEPENTVRSFRKAVEMGVDAVELDIRKTKDNELVVIHDENVKKTTNGNGLVSDLTLQQIKGFSTDKNDKIPTLKEAFEAIDKKVIVFVELKETGYEDQVLQVIDKMNRKKSVVVVSFLEDALKKVRQLDHEIQTGLIYAKHKNPLKSALELKAQWLLAFYRFIHTANVQKAHENGLKVLVWTVNTPGEVGQMKKKGVDAIASDKPDIL